MNIIRNVHKVFPILSYPKHSSALLTNHIKYFYLKPIQTYFYSIEQEINSEIKPNRVAPHFYRCSVNDPVRLRPI